MARLKKYKKPFQSLNNDDAIVKKKKAKKVTKAKEPKQPKVIKKRRIVDEKLKKHKKIPNVLIVDPKKHRKDSMTKRLANVFSDTFYEYADITKVNGMHYLRRFVTSGWLRFMWSCIMISLLSFAATLIFLLYRRYLDSPTRVTISSPMPIVELPFPAITICHPQNIMEYKSKEFVKKL